MNPKTKGNSREGETLAERKARKTIGSRGEKAESKVQKNLTGRRATSPLFDFDRLLDSRAAGAIVPAQVSDFLVFYKGRSATLEVKQLKKGTRLAKGKFPQHPRMLRRERAGCRGFLVALTEETNTWWVVQVKDMEHGAKSWNLKDVGQEFADVGQAMGCLMGDIIADL